MTPACAAEQLVALTALNWRGSLAKAMRARQGTRMVPLSFAGEDFALTTGRALYWPRERALLVADLHLEKASFYAKHGQLLPPYDSRETLERVALAIRETGARRVFTLGDNFHDSAGTERLEPHAAGMLAALTRATDWVWITGNHDASMEARSGGALASELEIAGIEQRPADEVGKDSQLRMRHDLHSTGVIELVADAKRLELVQRFRLAFARDSEAKVHVR